MKLIPYLIFNGGKCDEAFAFYAKVLRGQIALRITYGDLPDMPGCEQMPEDTKTQIAHVHLVAGGASIMGGDGPVSPGDDNVVNIDVDSVEEAERIFTEMSAGGQVKAPFGETPWALRWGMLADRYGKPWMVNCMKPQQH